MSSMMSQVLETTSVILTSDILVSSNMRAFSLHAIFQSVNKCEKLKRSFLKFYTDATRDRLSLIIFSLVEQRTSSML